MVLINICWNYPFVGHNFCLAFKKIWSEWEVLIRKTSFLGFAQAASDVLAAAEVKRGYVFLWS